MTTPCVVCGKPVDSEVFEDELGFCLDCSNKFWDSEGDWKV